MKQTSKVIVVIALVGLLSACKSKHTTSDRIAAIETAVSQPIIILDENLPAISLEERMRQLNVPAVSIAVISEGKLEWAKAYGFSDKEKDVLATTDTLFQAASISKPVAAMAALKLVQNGRINLDQNVNNFLQSWKIPDNEFTNDQKVTLRRLLNHSAGTTVWGFPGYASDIQPPSTIEILEGQGNTEAVHVWKEPGQNWQYSGGGYTVIELLMSDVLKQSFPQLMKSILLEPLDMRNSSYEQPLPITWHDRIASGYDETGNKITGLWHIYPERAAAGLWTTPSDLAQYIIEVQQAYRGNGRVLSEEMARTMLQAGINNHGLGPFIDGAGNRFSHGGSNAGFKSVFKAFTADGAGAIVMTNSDNGSQLAEELIFTIAREYGWHDLMPQTKKLVPISSETYKSLVGSYQSKDHLFVIEITYEESKLFIRVTGGERQELLPEAELIFFARSGLHVEFVRDNGIVTTLITGEGTVRAEKN